jgi:DNA-binding PadR family transcriptional regulator
MNERQLYSGLVRLFILHHASRTPVFGLEIIEDLARHGYRLSAGTLYPLLHSMERSGYLRSRRQEAARRHRRIYRATSRGRKALDSAEGKLRSLFTRLLWRK